MQNIRLLFLKLINSNICMFILLVSVGSFICSVTQFEFGWDFANYHFYNAYAFLNNRLNYDIVPASINTFFNPLIELPLYFLIEKFNSEPRLLFAFQGIWFGLLLFAFYKFETLFFDKRTIRGVISIFLALAIAATGQAVWFQAGTSTNEVQIAFLVYSALYITFKMVKFPRKQTAMKFFTAGLILGAGLGLKSTMIFICLAIGLSLIVCFKYLKKPLKYITLFAVGGLLGYLLLNGWWMYKMWSLYGNPFFPMLNGIFHSPYFDNFNFTDKRFIPPFPYSLIFPYIWLSGKYRSAEIPFYDLRGGVFYTLALLFILYMLIKPKRITNFYHKKHIWCLYAVFVFFAYMLWINIFAIYRYILVVEMAATIFFVKLMMSIHPKTNIKFVLYYSILATISGILILNPKFGRSWPKGSKKIDGKVVAMEKVRLPENTLVKLYNFPTAGVIPLLAKENKFRALGYSHLNVKYMQGSDFVERGEFRKIRDKIEHEHHGPVVVIYRDLFFMSQNHFKLHEALQPAIEGMYCRFLTYTLDNALIICVPPELKNEILLEEDKYGKK